MWVYGTTSAPHLSSRHIQAWVIDSYLRGATGVVPWQTVNKDGKAMRRGDPLALFIYDGPEVIHHSMRLKAYRRAQQDVEYLELLRKRRGFTRRQIREFVARHVCLDGREPWSPVDSGERVYDKTSPEGFRRLREAAAKLIEGAR